MELGSGAFGRWFSHKGEARMSGISSLKKEIPESLMASSSMWGHIRKIAICEPGNSLSPDTKMAGALNWDFIACRTVRNQCLLLKPPSLWYFYYSSPNWLRQFLNTSDLSLKWQGEIFHCKVAIFPFIITKYFVGRYKYTVLQQIFTTNSSMMILTWINY